MPPGPPPCSGHSPGQVLDSESRPPNWYTPQPWDCAPARPRPWTSGLLSNPEPVGDAPPFGLTAHRRGRVPKGPLREVTARWSRVSAVTFRKIRAFREQAHTQPNTISSVGLREVWERPSQPLPPLSGDSRVLLSGVRNPGAGRLGSPEPFLSGTAPEAGHPGELSASHARPGSEPRAFSPGGRAVGLGNPTGRYALDMGIGWGRCLGCNTFETPPFPARSSSLCTGRDGLGEGATLPGSVTLRCWTEREAAPLTSGPGSVQATETPLESRRPGFMSCLGRTAPCWVTLGKLLPPFPPFLSLKMWHLAGAQ